MSAEIKFCGLTRAKDAEQAVALGATYTGVIFAGGPRQVTQERAADVLAVVPSHVTRVGVFGEQKVDEIVHLANHLRLGVVQLHGSFSAKRVAEIRRGFGGRVWPVCRVHEGALPGDATAMIEHGDGLLLDTLVPGMLGGTGVPIAWAALVAELARVRTRKPIVLAGGLRPENVAQAIGILQPDVVDVSSGVEVAPGIKDHDRMRAFHDAVEGVTSAT